MKDHSGCKRQFYHLSSAWYANAVLRDSKIVDEVMIGFYFSDGGGSGEFAVRWEMLGDKITPRLEVFDDAWSALWEFRDLLERLSEVDDEKITPSDLVKILIDLKIEDATPTVSPYYKGKKELL